MKYNSKIEKCATCDYWGGDRDIVNFGNYVEVELSAKGACNCPGSSSRNINNKQAIWNCPQWNKWGALKSPTPGWRTGA